MKDFRPNLVNVLIGVSAALFVFALFLPMIDFDIAFWDWFPQIAILVIGAIISGAVAAGVINRFQPQGHQTGESQNQEEKRSAKGSIGATAIITLMISLIRIENYNFLWISGLILFAIAVALWKVPGLFKKK